MWHFAHPRRIRLRSRAAPRFPKESEPPTAGTRPFSRFWRMRSQKCGRGFHVDDDRALALHWQGVLRLVVAPLMTPAATSGGKSANWGLDKRRAAGCYRAISGVGHCGRSPRSPTTRLPCLGPGRRLHYQCKILCCVTVKRHTRFALWSRKFMLPAS
jgi:hypothetical protein